MAELLLTNIIIVGTTYGIETLWFNNLERNTTLIYDNIELIKPEKEAELIEDLRQKTGLDIFKVTVGELNFLRDTAQIKVYYREASKSA
jgi:hypothetical protein